MFCIHRAVEVRRFFGVPDLASVSYQRAHGQTVRTNLIATWVLFSKLVPSKMTPKDPSPIFLPTL